MLEFFENYIRAHSSCSNEEIAMIKSLAISKRLKKKQFLLRPGDVCRFHTFVCNGCLRSYRIGFDGSEHILSFSSNNHWISDQVSLATGEPSTDYIDALEDSDIIQVSVDNFKNLLRDIPNFDALRNKIITDDSGRTQDRIYMMISQQAEERYRHFVRLYPHLYHRIPLFMIASYLGVTRETLTRIRGNAVVK
ncbi:Crp/Fnr family transcriptional regulator [Mucilaginibacter sabulilitoris]|uniref:Crp/Fnr family transcriptional regulator n=1 Tax=Mucilaginibacter sabulilitoris TaxID=1173583 RepID=A0ABZ0TXQ6_9SPHI|nr:Crp/Fnr family transcriptional regulator [Mucilaginibacter sabulilitoris]WPU96938.1 Crp/Fnr family transcriptional regulator [Mucilaginibacter sabulilitoris]